MSKTDAIFSKIDACSNLEELAKLSDLNQLKSSLKSYLRAKAYHAKHNAKNAEMVRLYKLERPDSELP